MIGQLADLYASEVRMCVYVSCVRMCVHVCTSVCVCVCVYISSGICRSFYLLPATTKVGPPKIVCGHMAISCYAIWLSDSSWPLAGQTIHIQSAPL